MAKGKFITAVTQNVNKAAFKVKQHSPEILVIGGVVGMGVAATMALKKGSKIDEILTNHGDKLEKMDQAVELELEYEEGCVYTEEVAKSDKRILRTETALEIAKAVGPSVLVYAVSATSILAGLNILRKRNLAVVAAYATLSEAFTTYRERVVDEYGEDADKALRYGKKEVEIEVMDADGNPTGKTEKVHVDDPIVDDYVVYFKRGCANWVKDMNFNVMTVQSLESYLSDMLVSKSYVYLNEAYECFGIHGTRAGQSVGWIYDPANKDHTGDNIVKIRTEVVRLQNEDGTVEDAIRLDFNVDGEIIDDPRVFGSKRKHQTIM